MSTLTICHLLLDVKFKGAIKTAFVFLSYLRWQKEQACCETNQNIIMYRGIWVTIKLSSTFSCCHANQPVAFFFQSMPRGDSRPRKRHQHNQERTHWHHWPGRRRILRPTLRWLKLEAMSCVALLIVSLLFTYYQQIDKFFDNIFRNIEQSE